MSDLFDVLDDLTVHKTEFDSSNEEYRKQYPPFMVNRFVSMTELYIPIVNEVNMYPDIPKEAHHRYFSTILPKRKHFFKYIKKAKDFSQAEKELICEYFECSMNDADRYINTMSEDEIKQIIKVYKHAR